MSGVGELYQELILDHNRSPRNYRRMDDATGFAEGRNPLCGDQLTVWLKVDGDTVVDASFHGSGCAISKSSASLMTAAVKGRTRGEALRMFEQFQAVVTGTVPAAAARDDLGKLAVFSGISAFPVRVKCATLAWHALKAALGGPAQAVSTE
ncbi:MAG TPA: SUF system NifU family Fe-S cluster assembly protein [Gemmatimonadales bacterium]|nr:SUF system NifU family Fe-S cluster assembly protein [Gemmatimonadales bacterium]